MKVLFDEAAWSDYLSWQSDRKTLLKINRMIEEITRNPVEKGTGKGELLAGNWRGYRSRRINHKDRLVYLVVEDELRIAQLREHY